MRKLFTPVIFNKVLNTLPPKLFFLLLPLCCNVIKSYATAWTTSTAGDITVLSNWTNGSTSPSSFTTPGDTWTVNLAMTIAPSVSSVVTWTVGTSASAAVTVTFATGGGLTQSSTSSTATIIIYGDCIVNAGTISVSGTSAHYNMNVYGNNSMTGGNISIGGTSSVATMNVYGNHSMTAGNISTGGTSATTVLNVYGNYSMSGASYMANNGTSATSTVHLALSSSSGTMLADNTSTGTWSKTNIFIDAGCTAQLDGDFSVSTAGIVSTTTATYGLTVNGTLICPAAYVENGTGMFKLNSAATLKVAHATGINGAITSTPVASATFNTGANYVFNGSAAQVTGTYLPPSLVSPDSITISNSAGVTLTQTTATTGTLLFTSGILHTTSSFTMSTPGASTAVTGAGLTSYVDGTLIKTITGLTSVNYEVGNITFAPMSLALSVAGTAGSLGVMVTHGLHPNVATSSISTGNIANDYWTITNYASAGPTTVTPTAVYQLADIIGGSNTSFATQEYTGSAWLSAPITSTNTATPFYSTKPNTGIALATLPGAYIFGNISCGTLPITGPTSVCTGATIALSDATPAGIWASGSPTVASVSTSGIVSGLTAGSATISYTVGTCTVTSVITVNAGNGGTITGKDSVCLGASHAITLSDNVTGGVWTSSNTAKATIDPSTGVVTGIATGTITISYTVTSTCGTYTVTRSEYVRTAAQCATETYQANGPLAAGLHVFPNPNGGAFTMDVFSDFDEEAHVMVMNVVGERMREITTPTNTKVDVRLNTATGVYILVAYTAHGKYIQKIVVE